jgi:transcriptional regulator with PAS, ATPase and Fis domain
LDEVGEIPMGTQTKLLRVIQEREFERVGGTQTIHVDIRIVSATNKNLQKAIQDGVFRQDLFYRLNIFTIDLPPLRDRKEDVPRLIETFVSREAQRLGHDVTGPSARALDALMDYDWPGNVRELKNVIERAAVLAGGEPIDMPHLPPILSVPSTSYVCLPNEDVDFDREMENFERRLILHAFEKSGRVKAKAAKMLGIDRNRFRYKLEHFGIKD